MIADTDADELQACLKRLQWKDSWHDGVCADVMQAIALLPSAAVVCSHRTQVLP